MEVSVRTMHFPARWSVNPLLAYSSLGRRRAGKDLQGVSVPRQADPHAGTDAADDPALMALRCVGAGHRGAIFPRRRRIPIPVCRHRQIHQVAESNPSGQNQQAISSEVHQVYHMQIRSPKLDHHRQWVQFTSGTFQGYCEDLGIQICYASSAHPESNGQVERANVEMLKGLKTRTYDGLKKHGLMSFHAHCGATGPHPVEPQERRLSSWCMGPRPSFPRKSPWALCV
jgi:transposase InsO family protein